MSKLNKTPLIIATILIVFGLFISRGALLDQPYYEGTIIMAILAGIQFGCALVLIGDYFDSKNRMYKDQIKELIRQAYVNGYEKGYHREDWLGEIEKYLKENNL